MSLKPIPLSQDKMKANHKYWLEQHADGIKPEEDILFLLRQTIPVTHTFPFIKKTAEGDVVTYETIFADSTDNGIFSNGLRELKNINPDDERSSRNIPEGLKNYVFAYLGMHQPYYGRTAEDKIGLHTKPFGVFLKNPESSATLEAFPHNHATRRDISESNEQVNRDFLDLEYLLGDDTRILIAYELCNDREYEREADQLGKFWHYYGSPEHWKLPGYANNSWKKKAEFHFFEKIHPSEIAAVLWPVWIDESDGIEEIYSKTHNDVVYYSKQFPDIRFITYDLDLRRPEACFIEASYIALKFFLKNSIFPEDISVAKNVLDLDI